MILFGVLLLYFNFFTKNKLQKITDLRVMIAGAVVQSFGFASHQLYFGTMRLWKNTTYHDWYSWLHENIYLELIPLQLLAVGTVLVLAPFWHIIQPSIIKKNERLRKRQYVFAGGLAFGIFWFLYLKIMFTKL